MFALDARWAVRSFEHDRGANVRCALCGDLVLDCGGHQDVDVGSEEVFGVDLVSVGETTNAPSFVGVVPQRLGVDSVAVHDSACVISDMGDGNSHPSKRTCGVFANVAEALDCSGGAAKVSVDLFEVVGQDERCALAGGLVAPDGSAGLNGLSCDDAAGVLAIAAAAKRVEIGVHHPHHVLSSGADIGCGDVVFGADVRTERMGEASDNAFDFGAAVLARIEANAALGAAEGDVRE